MIQKRGNKKEEKNEKTTEGMAINKYQLEIKTNGSNAVFEIQYKNGKFFRLQKVKGKFADRKQRIGLFHVVPDNESNIERINTDFKDRVIYTPILSKNSNTIFNRFKAVYFEFHKSQIGFEARFTPAEGKALSLIIKYLLDQTVDRNEEGACAVWEVVFQNWESLTKYYQGKIRLVEINSNLTNILNQLKNGANSKEGITDREMAKAFFERYGSTPANSTK